MRVFLSYRRNDSADVAGRIFDRLESRYGARNVFKDVDSLAPGEEFMPAILDRIRRSDVILILIGRSWATAELPDGTLRLNHPKDYVRIEVEEALRSGKTVIPVLVGHASMPAANQLPSSLQPLRTKHTVSVRPDPDFRRDLDFLVACLSEDGTTPVRPPQQSRLAWLRSPWRDAKYWWVHSIIASLVLLLCVLGSKSNPQHLGDVRAFPLFGNLMKGSWILTERENFAFGSGEFMGRLFDSSLSTASVWTFLPSGELKAGTVDNAGYYTSALLTTPTTFNWKLRGSSMVITDSWDSKGPRNYEFEIESNEFNSSALKLLSKEKGSLSFLRVPLAIRSSVSVGGCALPPAFYLGLAFAWRTARRFSRPWQRFWGCWIVAIVIFGGSGALAGYIDELIQGPGFLSGPGFTAAIAAMFGAILGLILALVLWVLARRQLKRRQC